MSGTVRNLKGSSREGGVAAAEGVDEQGHDRRHDTDPDVRLRGAEGVGEETVFGQREGDMRETRKREKG